MTKDQKNPQPRKLTAVERQILSYALSGFVPTRIARALAWNVADDPVARACALAMACKKLYGQTFGAILYLYLMLGQIDEDPAIIQQLARNLCPDVNFGNPIPKLIPRGCPR